MPPADPSTEPTPPISAKKTPWFPLLFLLLVLGLTLFGEKGILRAVQANRHQQSLQQELRRQEEANAALRREIESLRSDRRYLEEIARRELGMVREGELVYKFPPQTARP